MSIGMAPNLAGGLQVAPFGSGTPGGGGASGDPFAIPSQCNGGGGGDDGGGGGDDGGGGGGGGGGSCSLGGGTQGDGPVRYGLSGGGGSAGGGSMSSLGGSVSNNFLSVKQNRGIPVPMPGNARPSGERVWHILSSRSLCPPDPYPVPDPLPGPDDGNTQTVWVKYAGYALPDVPITCVETGVTLDSSCMSVSFYHKTGGVYTYKVPAGTVPDCTFFHFVRTFNGASQSGTVPNDVSIVVTA